MRERLKRLGSLRFTSGFAIVVAVALLVTGVVLAVVNENQTRAQRLREATVQAEILAGSVAGALAFDDDATAREYVAALKANHEVEAVGVYDEHGRLAAGYTNELGELPATNRLGAPGFEGGDLIVTVPVVQGSTRLGSVYLRTITEPLPRRLARYAGVGMLIIMAALIVAVLGASNASLTQAHRGLQVEMAERAKTEAALRKSQAAEAEARLAVETERGRAALRQSEQQLELALRAGRLGTWALDLASGRLIASEIFRDNFGVGADAAFDRYAALAARVHPDDRVRQQQDMDAAIGGHGDLETEFRVLAADGEIRWVLLRGRASGDGDGKPARMTGVSLDITARKRADERQRLLLDELNHRVKNTLATVQSIALQTRRNADAASFETALMARIDALSRAHDLLSEVAWEGASLREVIARTLAPYVGDEQAERFSMSGPRVRLGPNAAVSLAMAFHELATNAAKYGSLSVADGRVDIAWRSDSSTSPALLDLEWRESGGPAVTKPRRRGFGSRLVERGLAREFGGEVELAFEPEGVRCAMRLPLAGKMQVAA